MSKDWDHIAKVEKAIREKYGDKAIANPKSTWTPEKEKRYLASLKDIHKSDKHEDEEKINVNGVLISKKLINKESRESCPVCGVYSFNKKDDFYLVRYECCFSCFVEFVEDREERWKEGWRPDEAVIKARRL